MKRTVAFQLDFNSVVLPFWSQSNLHNIALAPTDQRDLLQLSVTVNIIVTTLQYSNKHSG